MIRQKWCIIQQKFDVLPESTKIKRTVASRAKRMLRHRSGTEFEDLAFIDSKTGEFMVREDYSVKKEVLPSRVMKKMAKEAEDYSIIAIHNHPTSGIPSLADLKSACKIKYKYGIVVCHDGTIYKYSVSENFNKATADGALDILERTKYIDDEDERFALLERALNELRDAGVDMEVF